MARRRSVAPPRARRGLTTSAAKKATSPPPVDPAFPYPTLTAFLENGHGLLEIGHLPFSPFGAVIGDDDMTYAAVAHREGESIPQLLARLEAALRKGFEQDRVIDEFAD